MSYPTACDELKAMIDAEWPVVRESNKSIEQYEEFGNISLKHRVLRPCGFEIEGDRCDDHPLIFSEDHAIRALWFRYKSLSPAADLCVDMKPVMFVWRNFPETHFMHGIWTARMRYSCLWRDRFGKLTSFFAVQQSLAA